MDRQPAISAHCGVFQRPPVEGSSQRGHPVKQPILPSPRRPGRSFPADRHTARAVPLSSNELSNRSAPKRGSSGRAAAPATVVSLEAWGARFLAARIDIDTNTKKNYASAIKKITETFGQRDPGHDHRDRGRGVDRRPRRDTQTGDARPVPDHVPPPARPRRRSNRTSRATQGEIPKQERDDRTRRLRSISRRSSRRSGRSGSCCSSPSSTARSGSARPSRFGRPTSTPPVSGFACRSPRRSATRARWVYLPDWLMRGDRGDVPARGSGARAQGVPGDQRGVRVPGDVARLQERPRSRTTTRTTSVIGGSRSGTSQVFRLANSPSAPVTRGRR